MLSFLKEQYLEDRTNGLGGFIFLLGGPVKGATCDPFSHY